jgi:hypothetical protein
MSFGVKTIMKKTKLILSLLLLVATLVGFVVYAFTPPKGNRYYVPENYAGWVCISYNVDGAPALEIKEGYLIHKIPEDGILKTSSAPRLSPTKDEYFYYKEKEIRKANELQHGGGYSKEVQGNKIHHFNFWLSSGNLKTDYEKYVKNRDSNTDPECGPWKRKI